MDQGAERDEVQRTRLGNVETVNHPILLLCKSSLLVANWWT